MALGLLFGAGLGVTPYHATVTGPVVERVEMYLDRSRSVQEQERVRWIAGGTVEEETIAVLSKNPVGRDTLNALRDRFGVIRLPSFFLSRQESSYAEHSSAFDAVYLNENELTSRGWTVEDFLRDPEKQRRLIREMDSTILHELTHAVQGRRSP
ncbi:MAG: hypothetical protein M0D55_17675 [Elusimicrobiota bacterium]|nr:MAG: hypothetical protein M0D55_17675 [Elusimicrobiota bacterium]